MQLRRLSSADADFQEKFSALVAVDASVDPEITRRAEAIVEDVRKRGDAAVLEYTERFDRLPAKSLSELMITAEEMRAALEGLPPQQREALEEAARRIREFHEKELGESFSMTDSMGSVLGQRVSAVDSVGLYVPGGKAAYPSSVLMNAMPALVAGVKRIEMVVPTPGGERNQLVLAAASLAGVTRAFAIGGAQAVAASVYLARIGKSKQEIKEYVETTFGYNLSRSCDEIRVGYKFDVTCQGSVPEAIICFLESRDYEECVRLAVSLGGDSDTLAAIGGGIAEAYYRGVPEGIGRETLHRLPDEFLEVIRAFSEKYESISQRFV